MSGSVAALEMVFRWVAVYALEMVFRWVAAV